MQYLKNCQKQLMSLAVLFLMAVSVQAQTSSLTVTQKSGKIFVSNGGVKKVVAPAANNIQPVASATHVFYINSAVSDKMVIRAYNVADNTTADIVKAEELNSGSPAAKKITNLIFDNTAGRLYFSTMSVDTKGYENYLTWYVDPVTNTVKLYADGKITSVDNTGTIQVEMHGVDAKGAYTQTMVKSVNGAPGAMGTRKYTTTTNSANN